MLQLDVKTTAKGGIQIVTKTNGTLQLTTKKKIAKKAGPNTGAAKSNAPGNFAIDSNIRSNLMNGSSSKVSKFVLGAIQIIRDTFLAYFSPKSFIRLSPERYE